MKGEYLMPTVPIWVVLLLVFVAVAAAVACGIISYKRGYNDRKEKA